ncbi:uncharacterized protein N0V89_006882 [Didymosphaeria variabile]|uniref:Uncharacterized protein n=1 Tax=Didymosphaeria variabile TaxID=1932322 RepID=A0A9W8XIF2_9PLEO|nr:uncharacterized protein N0V89_006882 [Didymosphaeria variabile]KAJ4351539.1 hypothetical protein N0V89_006882 [Didymosphaeria variabile]
MAEQADGVPAGARHNTGSSPLSDSTITAPPSPTSSLDRERQQKKSSDAAEYILGVVRPETSTAKSSAGRTSAAKSSAGKKRATETPAADPADVTVNASGSKKRNTPRVDRAGNVRPDNMRFLTRDVAGKLDSELTGQDTQLEEIQDWIKSKKYKKFELLPDASEYTFEDMDPNFVTEPLSLKNQGRKLLVGKDGDTGGLGYLACSSEEAETFTAIKDMKKLNDSIDELYYPFDAFTHSAREDALVQLLAVLGYVFLLCGEADVVFTDSSKGPHTLGTALTCIKETYAPNDEHATAATVDRNIQTGGVASSDTSETQLETVNKVLSEKKMFDSMQTLVSDRSIYVFKDYTPGTLQRKGIVKAHNRALFLGEDGHVEAWAVISREPNKAGLGWIVNYDKATGEQWVADFWLNVPTLTFPFEAFQQKGKEVDWRKLTYTIAYVFLSCHEAEVALNKGKSFWKHCSSIPKDVAKHYGSREFVVCLVCLVCLVSFSLMCLVSPPKGWPYLRKPGDFPGPGLAQTPNDGHASSTTAPNAPDVDAPSSGKTNTRNVLRKKGTKPNGNTVRNSLQEILGPNFKLPVQTLGRTAESSVSTLQDDRTYTAPDGEYRSIDDLDTALFLQDQRDDKGKRSAFDDQENRPAKFQRLEATRARATKLRLRQERKVGEVKRLLQEEERKMMLLEETECDLAGEMGDLTAAMTDNGIAELQRA